MAARHLGFTPTLLKHALQAPIKPPQGLDLTIHLSFAAAVVGVMQAFMVICGTPGKDEKPAGTSSVPMGGQPGGAYGTDPNNTTPQGYPATNNATPQGYPAAQPAVQSGGAYPAAQPVAAQGAAYPAATGATAQGAPYPPASAV